MHIFTQCLIRVICSRIYVLAFVLGMANGANAEVVVVVSSQSPVQSLSLAEVAQIFLGQLLRFPTDGQAVPIDQDEGIDIRDEFYKKVTGKDASQLKAYWAKITFAGYGRPPRAVANSDQVKKLINEKPNHIGYINKDAVDKSVRVVFASS